MSSFQFVNRDQNKYRVLAGAVRQIESTVVHLMVYEGPGGKRPLFDLLYLKNRTTSILLLRECVHVVKFRHDADKNNTICTRLHALNKEVPL